MGRGLPMDWLEEYEEKIKRYIKNTSLARAAMVYALIAILGSVACTMFTANLLLIWINVLSERTPSPDKVVFVLNEMRQWCPYLYMAAAILLASRHYTDHRIRAAIGELRLAVGHMAAGDLGFEAAWQSGDEFAPLFHDLTKLRELLKKDKLDQWRMGEEQRRINAAFAHDIRTPLTVMKGYSEFLIKYVPAGKVTEQTLLDKLERISYQGDRLLSFSKTMTTLQTMEQREVHCRQQDAAAIKGRIREIAEGMKKEGIAISFTDRLKGNPVLTIDLEMVLEAVENVLQNALRYAEKKIEITEEYRGQALFVYVKDDGAGFSPKALREADKAYFSENKKEDKAEGHFGIGLSVTKMLCEKHGGELKLFNNIEGGAVTAVSFFAGSGNL